MEFLFWIAIIFISFAAEVMTAQLVSIWFMVGGILALITSLFTPSLPMQMIVFMLVSLFMIILVRPFIKNILKFKIQETNSDRLIGKIAIVTENINNKIGEGAVSIEGMIWTARSRDGDLIDINESVQVDAISGVKLIVHKI